MKYKFLTAVIASNFRRLAMPIKLSYAVTYRCNLACRMCRIWKKSSLPPEIQPKDLARFLHGSRGLYWFGITGGEPFLREDIFDIADAALTECPDLRAIHFATNGTLQHRIEAFMRNLRPKYPSTQIVATISIDGPEALHDQIRGRQGVWAQAVETYKILRAMPHTKPQFGFTLSHSNLDQFAQAFEDLRRACSALQFDDITVNIFQRSAFYYENQEMPALEQEALIRNIRLIQQMDDGRLSLNNFLRRQYLKLYRRYMEKQCPPLKCQSFSATAFLDPAGNLFPCAVYNRKFLNIRETDQTLAQAWQDKTARQIHEECARHQCPGCWSPCDAYSAIAGSLVPALLTR